MKFPQETINAFSIAALSTYAYVPEMNVAFDMGDCLMDAVPIQRVFISHGHGDHTRCLLRHVSLRRLLGMDPAEYYIPRETLEGFRAISAAWQKMEYHKGRKEHKEPNFIPLDAGNEVTLNRQLVAQAFGVTHTMPSLGYTLFELRKKLKPEYHGTESLELARLRREGVEFEDEFRVPRLTFIGDSTIETLYRERHIGQSHILFLELTFLMEDERELARRRGHTHLDDLLEFLQQCPDALQNEHIILKHFSMRYTRRQIFSILKARLPADFLARVHILA
ncbi:MAG: MBL fold metallo-hydrolase [Deltaproteobacteria bacterium]|nr:MBL fold metallo-hydrolase [Deltaproteobacteria bacterium]